MARVFQNVVMQGVKGTLGDQLIFKKDKAGRTIISVKPTFDEDRMFSLAQQAQHQAFREATAYAKDQTNNPLYLAKAEGTPMNAYNIAVADWFNRPQILEIDLSGWVNGDGGTIRVRVQDDVSVQGVKVTIADENGTFLEEGEAVESSALWWEYNTAQAAANNMRVTASAKDLPGHITERTELKGHPMMP
jgi:hypothetical protein